MAFNRYSVHYDVGHFITKVRIASDSSMSGHILGDSPLVKDHHFEILQVEKSDGRKYPSSEDISIEEGDILLLREVPFSEISETASVLGIRSRRKMINEGVDVVNLPLFFPF